MSDTENPASGHWAAPDEVWARVRADYSDGLSGPACCRRHGVQLTTVRDRAAREGWRRIDQAGPPANRLDPDDEGVQLEIECGGDLDRIDFAQLSYVAVRRMMRAVMRGDAVEALRWQRVRDAMEHEEAEVQRWIDQQDTVRQRLDGSHPDPDCPDGLDGVFKRR